MYKIFRLYFGDKCLYNKIKGKVGSDERPFVCGHLNDPELVVHPANFKSLKLVNY